MLFSMARNDTILGFFGSLISVALTCGGFGCMAYYGFLSLNKASAHKNAFIWGVAMSILCFVSMIFAIFAHHGGFGDFVLLVLPLVYTLGIFKTA